MKKISNEAAGAVYFLCGRKERDFYTKSPIRSLLQADLGTIMQERTSPLFGINQMLVSATGGEGSSPSKNHVKIGPLKKLINE